jgi:hypothetical protein
VNVTPADDLQAVIDANPEGTTFCFAAGTYVIGQALFPKNFDSFIAGGVAILTGNDVGVGAIDGRLSIDTVAAGVAVKGFIVERFTTTGIGGPDAGIRAYRDWVLEGNEFRLNHHRGVRLDSGTVFRNNNVHHNGQLGIVGSGMDVLVEDNEIAFNNTGGFSRGVGGATKFTGTTNLILRGNNVHDNAGHGLWADGNPIFTTYEDNTISNNLHSGINHEISYDAVIRNNVLINNASSAAGLSLWWGANIFIHSSPNVEIYGNTVESTNGGHGIGLRDSIRGSGKFGLYEIRNAYVHDNVVKMRPSAETGMVGNRPENFATANNRFQHNTYYVSDLAGRFWQWQGLLTKAEWQATGNDTTGTFLVWL